MELKVTLIVTLVAAITISVHAQREPGGRGNGRERGQGRFGGRPGSDRSQMMGGPRQWAAGGLMDQDSVASDSKVQGDLSSVTEEGMLMEKEKWRLLNQSVMVKDGPVVSMVLEDFPDVLTQAVAVIMDTTMVLTMTRPTNNHLVSKTTAAARRMADLTVTTTTIITMTVITRQTTTITIITPKATATIIITRQKRVTRTDQR
uniref:185/333 n=1 Tax=Heliocidaris erythrogramma TaxID=7634 RepID=I3W886_HELER|nr:185/333 [Heliocidaris erythrogramma]